MTAVHRKTPACNFDVLILKHENTKKAEQKIIIVTNASNPKLNCLKTKQHIPVNKNKLLMIII